MDEDIICSVCGSVARPRSSLRPDDILTCLVNAHTMERPVRRPLPSARRLPSSPEKEKSQERGRELEARGKALFALWKGTGLTWATLAREARVSESVVYAAIKGVGRERNFDKLERVARAVSGDAERVALLARKKGGKPW